MLKAYTNFTEARNFAEDIVNFSTEVAKVKLFKYMGGFMHIMLTSQHKI